MISSEKIISRVLKSGILRPNHQEHLQSLLENIGKVELTQRETKINGYQCFSIVFKFVRRGSMMEEDFFKDNYDVWKVLRRGMSLHVIVYNDDDNEIDAHLLCGMHKFADPGIDFHHFEGKVVKSIAMEKENGEWAGIAAWKTRIGIMLIFGTKNVHAMVPQNDFDNIVEQYMKTIFSKNRGVFWERIAKQIKGINVDYLVETGNTFIGENITTSNQHLIKYKKDEIRWFAISGPNTKSFTAETPSFAINLFKDLGLKTVEYKSYEHNEDGTLSNEYLKDLEDMRLKQNTEGWVVYRQNSKGDTVNIQKEKNWIYVVTRASREKFKHTTSLDQIEKRFSTLHVPTDNPDVQLLLNKLRAFYIWFIEVKRPMSKNKKHKGKLDADIISSQWVSLYEEFSLLDYKPLLETYFTSLNDERQKIQRMLQNKKIIVIKGIPTTGKSTLARSLSYLLPKSIWLNQDNYASSKLFEKDFLSVLNKKNVKHIIIDKSFHNLQTRSFLFNLEKSIIEFKLPESPKDFIERRLRMRGAGHEKLFLKPNIASEIESVFIDKAEELSEKDEPFKLLSLNPDEERLTNLKLSCKFLDFNFKDEQYMNALTKSLNYEEECKTNTKKVLYWSLIPENSEIIKKCIPKHNFPHKIKNFHVTLLFVNQNVDQSSFVKHEREMFKVTITSVKSNDSIMCLDVECDIPDSLRVKNQKHHITLARTKKAKNVDSLAMMKGDHKTLNIEPVEINCMLCRVNK